MNNKNKGITLIALVITIIILLILAGISINTLNGENGIITRGQESKLKYEMTQLKEEFELFCIEKETEIMGTFSKEGVMASENVLVYNNKQEENKSIYDVMPSLSKSKYAKKVEIIKGEIHVVAKNKNEVKWLQEIGIIPNPWNIVDGVLMSSNTNLLLLGEDGTLVIPGSVTEIDKGAFANVEGIKRVIIPGSVKKIGDNAFSHNSTIEEVIIEDGVEGIGSTAFYSCTKLNKVKMANSVLNIGNSAFNYCPKLEEINLSNNLKVIPTGIFVNCTSLKNIIIPENVTKISNEAFSSCGQLVSINIPKNVESIGDSPFAYCKSLVNINVDIRNTDFKFSNGILMNSDETEMIYISSSAIQENTFKVPDKINKLTAGLLTSYPKIEKIIIPENVTEIDINFFSNNRNINSIVIDSNNRNYMSTADAIYDKNQTKLIYYYTNKIEVRIPEGIIEIASQAFRRNSLTILNLPTSLEKIQSEALVNTKLKSLNLGKNVSELAGTTFLYSEVINISIDEDNPYLIEENNVIYSIDENRNKVKLVGGVGKINSLAIPNGVKEIGNDSFVRKGITNVVIPNTVIKIGRAFNDCQSLETITIPSSVTSIDSTCFSKCINLKEIIVEKPKDSISGAPWGATTNGRVEVKWTGQ